jgi:hypothetical protein
MFLVDADIALLKTETVLFIFDQTRITNQTQTDINSAALAEFNSDFAKVICL